LLAALAAPAGARQVAYNNYPQQAVFRARFWERVKSPHIEEITRLKRDAEVLRTQVANSYWDPHMMPARRMVLRDALRRYERALELDPTRLDLRLEAAHTAFEAAEHGRAVEHYLTYREQKGEIDALARYNLAESYLRLRQFDDAAAELEGGLDSGVVASYDKGRYLMLLGYVHMSANRLDEATDALERAAQQGNPQYGGGNDYLMLAMLAVAYDRDEQMVRAHEAIDALRAIDPGFGYLFYAQPVMAAVPPSQRAYVPFSPASDRHYWLGVVHEAQGRYPEAAASWRAYLAADSPTYAARAQAHLAFAEEKLVEAARDAEAKARARAKQPEGTGAGAAAPPKP
jgi:tetratricopeptide (TPR) repeat protein